jgi:hypothetical protein
VLVEGVWLAEVLCPAGFVCPDELGRGLDPVCAANAVAAQAMLMLLNIGTLIAISSIDRRALDVSI